eukprot:comp22347_c0_seq1/m.53848 comp22347_c0_seq1/g.53848  ORF comp22347_c0_seq1/g.53848 comp22347_c0_seq1/m.53848 type:complete len:358 (+) comp22347_c0_seq1:368-1441(+)
MLFRSAASASLRSALALLSSSRACILSLDSPRFAESRFDCASLSSLRALRALLASFAISASRFWASRSRAFRSACAVTRFSLFSRSAAPFWAMLSSIARSSLRIVSSLALTSAILSSAFCASFLSRFLACAALFSSASALLPSFLSRLIDSSAFLISPCARPSSFCSCFSLSSARVASLAAFDFFAALSLALASEASAFCLSVRAFSVAACSFSLRSETLFFSRVASWLLISASARACEAASCSRSLRRLSCAASESSSRAFDFSSIDARSALSAWPRAWLAFIVSAFSSRSALRFASRELVSSARSLFSSSLSLRASSRALSNPCFSRARFALCACSLPLICFLVMSSCDIWSFIF